MDTAVPREAEVRFEISRLTDMGSWLTDLLARHGPACFVMGSEFPFRDLREVRYAAERV